MTEVLERPAILQAGGAAVALLDADTGLFVVPDTDPAKVRQWLKRVTQNLLAMPGEARELEVKHTFQDGMYMRELHIPKGTLLVGKVHKLACMNLVTKGDISVVTELGSGRVQAGYSAPSPAGIQKLGFAHEDTVFVNVFRTDETDPEKIDQAIAWDSYEMAELASPIIEGVPLCL